MESRDYEKTPFVLEKRGLHSECKWKKGEGVKDSPHVHEKREKKLICNDVTDAIGFTPLVRINNITKRDGIKWEILAKCEFCNPGGSIKDRVSRRMILDAEKNGKIKKGDVLIEPTSGNTGIGLSMVAAARGYKMVITMTEKMSSEKENTLRGLGTEIIRTPAGLPTKHVDSHIGVAYRLAQEIENSYMLDQYSNPSNPIAHYEGTAQEIWDQCEGRIDAVVVWVGTGGTITGIARFFKDKDPNIKIVGVDPHGSIVAEPSKLNDNPCPYLVEGVGHDFIPRALDRSSVDKWYKMGDSDSFEWARRLIKEEGLLVGGSSGGALWAALEEAKDMKEGQRIVVVFPDSFRNYMTKFLSDDWMYLNKFIDEKTVLDNYTSKLVPNCAWGKEFTVNDLPLKKSASISCSATIKEAIKKIGDRSELLVLDESEEIVGLFTTEVAMDRLSKDRIAPEDKITKSLQTVYRKTSKDIPLSELSRILKSINFVVVDGEWVVTRRDLLNFFVEKT